MDGVSVRDGRRRAQRGQAARAGTRAATPGLRAASAPDEPPVAVRSLRWILLGLDLGAVTLAWLITLLVPGEFTRSLSGSTTPLRHRARGDHRVVDARDRFPAPLPRTGVRCARGRDGSARAGLGALRCHRARRRWSAGHRALASARGARRAPHVRAPHPRPRVLRRLAAPWADQRSVLSARRARGRGSRSG